MMRATTTRNSPAPAPPSMKKKTWEDADEDGHGHLRRRARPLADGRHAQPHGSIIEGANGGEGTIVHRISRQGDADLLPRVLHVRYRLPSPARCARRLEAGTSPHSVRHERVRLYAEQAAHEVGPYRRRRDRQVPSPWRLRRVRHHGAPGPASSACACPHRRPRQLRSIDGDSRRCHALHRGASRQAGYGTSA